MLFLYSYQLCCMISWYAIFILFTVPVLNLSLTSDSKLWTWSYCWVSVGFSSPVSPSKESSSTMTLQSLIKRLRPYSKSKLELNSSDANIFRLCLYLLFLHFKSDLRYSNFHCPSKILPISLTLHATLRCIASWFWR